MPEIMRGCISHGKEEHKWLYDRPTHLELPLLHRSDGALYLFNVLPGKFIGNVLQHITASTLRTLPHV